MTTPAPNGIFDPVQGIVTAPDSGDWTTVTTWADFSQWNATPADPLIWALEPIDLGTSKVFNLKLTTLAAGLVEYKIYTSDTGLFEGEETITTIQQGDEGIAAFSGRYVWIEVFVYATGSANILYGIEYAISEGANRLSINNVDTSTLAGTSSARELALGKTVSAITNIQITPKTVTAYAVDLYVSNTPTSETVIPRVITKTGTPTFALVGIDNQPRDAVVDIIVEYLPEGYMSGNNLLLR